MVERELVSWEGSAGVGEPRVAEARSGVPALEPRRWSLEERVKGGRRRRWSGGRRRSEALVESWRMTEESNGDENPLP